MPVFANLPETEMHAGPDIDSKVEYRALMGAWLRDGMRTSGSWLEVETRDGLHKGWVRAGDVRSAECLKIFFTDVGQGDGALVESPQGLVIIDGGPSKAFYNWLVKRAEPVIEQEGKVHFEAVVVSHFDVDHFSGLTHVLKHPKFSFGTIYHQGIKRYDTPHPPGIHFDLGRTATRIMDGESLEVLTDTFSTLDQAGRLVDEGEMMATFRDFWRAAWNAHADGRLGRARRITSRDETLSHFSGNGVDNLRIEVLGPVPTRSAGAYEYVAFAPPEDYPGGSPSHSHTVNGHSVVIKLIFGNYSFLFGGDLNIPAEKHLMAHYHPDNPFQVDVAKACHHGSSDFSVEFLKATSPMVTVFSSGDNDTYGHPMADALGASARWMRGDHPLLFSTELARAITSKGLVKPGLISVRTNGSVLVAAQQKESVRKNDVWDSYSVPWPGAFPEAVAGP